LSKQNKFMAAMVSGAVNTMDAGAPDSHERSALKTIMVFLELCALTEDLSGLETFLSSLLVKVREYERNRERGEKIAAAIPPAEAP
jgi:hypothetical protein